MKRIALLLGLIFLTSCGPPAIDSETDESVGTINGKELRRVYIAGDGRGHFVYYFPSDPKQPVSNNYRSGKTSSVIVFVDGIPVSTNVIIIPQR